MGIRHRALARTIVVSASMVLGAALPAAGGSSIFYRPPVDAPVVDPFRPPASTYGPGNRGLTYDVPPETPVRASAPGTVVFAGPVAGTLHVTVRHADGLRTSYSFLESISVRRGSDVDSGAVVGTAGAGFHFGVRDGDRYLDPASLFGVVRVVVHLVPHDEHAPTGARSQQEERVALTATVRERGLLRRAVDWGVDRAAAHVERHLGALRTAVQLDPGVALASGLHALWRRTGAACTDDDVVTPIAPARGRTAVLVAGYGSTSSAAAIDDVDTETLGYLPSDVLRFSYAGGRTPGGIDDPGLDAITVSPYRAEHTFTDLRAHGRRLADLLEAVASARPGSRVDLLAHSQGGIVARLALDELDRRGRLRELGVVVTIGSPHRGVDLGTAALLAGPIGRRFLEPVRHVTDGGVDPSARSVRQMAGSSTMLLRLGREGVPAGVDFRTIGATGDLVVPADRATVDGEPGAVVGLMGSRAHDALPGHPDTTRELALALRGLAPGCRSVVERVVDAFVPEAVGLAQNSMLAGLALALPG